MLNLPKSLRFPLKIVGTLLLLILMGNIFQMSKSAFFPDPLAEENFFGMIRVPTNIAHRGASGHYPENTMLAFEKAVEKGADVLELDVWLSQDDQVVVIHDETVDRTTDGEGKVRDHTLDELQALDAAYHFKLDDSYPYRGKGVKIPTLKEVLTEFDQKPVVVEVKKTGEQMAAQVAEDIRKTEAEDRVLIASMDAPTVQALRKLLPDTASAAGEGEALQFYLLSKLGLAGFIDWDFEGLFVPTRFMGLPVLTPPFRSAARANGIHIHVWTVNDPEEMESLLNMNTQGILTDYPGLLKDIMDQTME